MQASNLQLNISIKPTTVNSADASSVQRSDAGGQSGGFSDWMNNASRKSAQSDRSESKGLPQDGSELPASDRRESAERADSAQRQDQNDSESSDTRSADTERADTNRADKKRADKTAQEERAAEAAENSDVDRSGSVTQVTEAEQSGENVEAKESSEQQAGSELGADPESSQSGVVSSETIDLAAAEESAGAQLASQQDGQQTAGEASVAQSQSQSAGQPVNADLSSELAAEQVQSSAPPDDGPDATRPPGLVSSAEERSGIGRPTDMGPPPGIERASEQGLAHGRPFSQSADSESLITSESSDQTAQSMTSESGELSASAGSQTEAGSAMPADPQSAQPVVTEEQSLAAAQSLDNDAQAQGLNSGVAGDEVVSVAEDSSALSVAPVSEQMRAANDRSINASQTVSSEAVRVQETSVGAGNSSGQQSQSNSQGTRQTVVEPQLAKADSAGTLAEAGGDQRRSSGDLGDSAGSQRSAATGITGAEAAATKLGSTASVTASTTTVPSVPPQVVSRMQQPQWGQKMGERALMMVQQGPRVAWVQLDPPELGALQVRVHLQAGDQVSLNFTAPNAAVRDVLEQHLPRLREMFAEQGLNLAQSDVRDQSAGGRDRGESESGRAAGNYAESGEESDLAFTEHSVPVGVVDYYA